VRLSSYTVRLSELDGRWHTHPDEYWLTASPHIAAAV
jgi:hypothetical protein